MAEAEVIRVDSRVIVKIGDHWDKSGVVSQISSTRMRYLVHLDTGEISWFDASEVRLELTLGPK